MNLNLTDEQKEQLFNEQIKGNNAQKAYNDFIKPFVEAKRKQLFEVFASLGLTESENLMEVKRMLYAIDTLDAEIRSMINTGQMASQTLNSNEEIH